MQLILSRKLESAIFNTEKGTRGYIFVVPVFNADLSFTEIAVNILPITKSDDIFNDITDKDIEVLNYLIGKEYRIILFHNEITNKNYIRMYELYKHNTLFHDFIMVDEEVRYYTFKMDMGLPFWQNTSYIKMSRINVPQYYKPHLSEIKMLCKK